MYKNSNKNVFKHPFDSVWFQYSADDAQSKLFKYLQYINRNSLHNTDCILKNSKNFNFKFTNKLRIQQCMHLAPAVELVSSCTEQSTPVDIRRPVEYNRNTSDIRNSSRALQTHNFHSQISVSTGKTLLDRHAGTRIVYLHHGCKRASDRFYPVAVVHMALVGTHQTLVHTLTCIPFDRDDSRMRIFPSRTRGFEAEKATSVERITSTFIFVTIRKADWCKFGCFAAFKYFMISSLNSIEHRIV